MTNIEVILPHELVSRVPEDEINRAWGRIVPLIRSAVGTEGLSEPLRVELIRKPGVEMEVYGVNVDLPPGLTRYLEGLTLGMATGLASAFRPGGVN